MVLKNDANYKQGIPDLIVLSGKSWAMLECKRSANETHQPNQDYYVNVFNKMSYSSFIHPENKEDVLNDLSKTFRAQEQACVPVPE